MTARAPAAVADPMLVTMTRSDLRARDAEQFAARNTYYGKPCTVMAQEDVPRYLLERWGLG
jgi:hypothetical protein